jgi:DNA-binding LacI/PurR family transcriptional regulator
MVTKMNIARQVGVSHTAVSQILNQNPNARVSDETRVRILATAREMGYYDSVPKEEKPRSTPLLIYLLSGVTQPDMHYMSIFNTLQESALKHHRAVAFINIGKDANAMTDALTTIDSLSPLGVIVDGLPSEYLVGELIKRKVALINIGTNWLSYDSSDSYPIPVVTYDQEECLYGLMSWFKKRGAKRIAMSLGLQTLPINRILVQAYRNAGKRLGLEYDPALIQSAEDRNGQETFQRLEILNIQYDAIILGSAGRALHVLPYLRGRHDKRFTRRIGVIALYEIGRDFLSDLVVCGPSINETAESIYATLSAAINYQKKKKQVTCVPAKLHQPLEA